ncbi:hypothetical protein [Leucothrix arctica]|nr:hypothetical protein [Leucothrix arctica]
MNINNNILKISFSLAVLLGSQVSFAGGTEAGTVVENTATLSYSVGGAAQSDIVSDVADFTVDNKVDLNVTGDSATNILVGPSSARSTTGNKLSYTLTNEGNLAQDFEIGVTHLTTDEFDAGTAPATATPQAAEVCQYTITPTTVPATALTGPHNLADAPIVSLGIDETALIEVICSMPNRPDVDDGHTSTIDVLATAVDAAGDIMVETAAADTEDAIDVVLADDDAATTTDTSDRNAMHSAIQTFEIDAPMLSVLKTSAVISDPLNLTVNPKRIPGAIIEYTITIQNTSDSEATGVTASDLLTAVVDGEVAFVASSIAVVGATGTVNTYASDTVTVTGITVPAGTIAAPGEVKVTFQVEIL